MTKKLVKYIATAAIILVVGYHSIYFKKLGEVKASSSAQQFNAANYARRFWKEHYVPGMDTAFQLSSLLTLLKTDARTAFDSHSHALGIGNLRYFLVRGEGTVITRDEDAIRLQLKPDSAMRYVTLTTDMIFGNSVRDATGLINISEFKNTMDFNNVSAELNNIVKAEVLPAFLKYVRKGSVVEFVGALELNQEHLATEALEIVPVRLKIIQP